MRRTRNQTFCPACAVPLSSEAVNCHSCGAPRIAAASRSTPMPQSDLPGRSPILVRFLSVAPIFLLLAVAGGLIQRHAAEQQWLASTYAEAASAANSGDLV